MLRKLLPLTLLVGFGTGCYAEGDVGYRARYAGPAVAAPAPGVEVVGGYDYPVYRSGGAYWRWHQNMWWSSPYRDRGWAVNARVPGHITAYHARYYRGGVVVRDHRRW